MTATNQYQQGFQAKGFAILPSVFSTEEVHTIATTIEQADSSGTAFRKTNELFAIRRILQEVPDIIPLLFTNKLKALIAALFGEDYFTVKSIYFDKPGSSNWFVAYHQDLMVSVDQKIILEGYGPWSGRDDQFAVQPPLSILQHNFTLRIHLDDTDESNGALRVIPGSHLKGIYRPETIDWTKEKKLPARLLLEELC